MPSRLTARDLLKMEDEMFAKLIQTPEGLAFLMPPSMIRDAEGRPIFVGAARRGYAQCHG